MQMYKISFWFNVSVGQNNSTAVATVGFCDDFHQFIEDSVRDSLQLSFTNALFNTFWVHSSILYQDRHGGAGFLLNQHLRVY